MNPTQADLDALAEAIRPYIAREDGYRPNVSTTTCNQAMRDIKLEFEKRHACTLKTTTCFSEFDNDGVHWPTFWAILEIVCEPQLGSRQKQPATTHVPTICPVASGAGYIQCSCGWRSKVEDEGKLFDVNPYNAQKDFEKHAAEATTAE